LLDKPAPGDVLADKYRVERVLGEGGMGVVLLATQLDLDRRVAIKLLTWGDGDQRGVARARFEREARVAAKLSSVHVARVLDIGKLDGDKPYMVMEYLEGEDLDSYRERAGRLRIDEAVGYLLQVCEAMAEAHSFGIVHRDLKPANLFLTRFPDGRPLVKVLDFGISKVEDDPRGGLTSTGGVLGTPYYMSPEQLGSSKHVTAESDIWAMGAILYELLTGDPAFGGESVAHVHANILREKPAPARRRRPDVPLELEAVIFRCLEKAPERRFRTVAELAAALAPFAPAPGASAAETAARILGAAPSRTEPLPLVHRAEIRRPPVDPIGETAKSFSRPPIAPTEKRAMWPWAVTAGVLAVAGGATLFAVHRSSEPGAVSAATGDVAPTEQSAKALEPTPARVEPTPARVEPTPVVSPAPLPSAPPAVPSVPASVFARAGAPAPVAKASLAPKPSRPPGKGPAEPKASLPVPAANPDEMLLHRR
jgi:serine/threonine-protein kinase